MNIMAPVNSYESAEAFIASGAKEIYLGADEGLFKTFSFTGRGKYSYNGKKVISDFQELKRITEYAHQHGIKVNFLCNYSLFSNEEKLKNYVIEYIEKGIESGVDSIVIGDVGILKLLEVKSYPVEIHASVYFKTINKQQLLFLKELGVSRTVLSYHITMNEIEDLVSSGIMDLEVVGYLGCSFFNGACSFLHDMGEGYMNDFDPGISCKGKYKVDDGSRSEVVKIFDAEAGCAICQMGKLEAFGVKALKIVGRERDYQHTAVVIGLYSKFLEYYRQGLSYEEVCNEIPKWWKKLWCSKGRCKYKTSNINYPYIIGG